MKQWFYAKFDSPIEAVDFSNKHKLQPGHVVSLANSIVHIIGMVNLTHVMYYAEKELEP